LPQQRRLELSLPQQRRLELSLPQQRRLELSLPQQLRQPAHSLHRVSRAVQPTASFDSTHPLLRFSSLSFCFLGGFNLRAYNA
jgi:hypothetical protein